MEFLAHGTTIRAAQKFCPSKLALRTLRFFCCFVPTDYVHTSNEFQPLRLRHLEWLMELNLKAPVVGRPLLLLLLECAVAVARAVRSNSKSRGAAAQQVSTTPKKLARPKRSDSVSVGHSTPEDVHWSQFVRVVLSHSPPLLLGLPWVVASESSHVIPCR
uniref:(northern house mosquito) hypothetical protein n=1 Tax=Culex pipiens TaxID=7175 RepID=A0A8D8E135_CULPI